MTKVQAINRVMKEKNRPVTLEEIYKGVKKFKNDVDSSTHWKAGIRGVLYREIRNGKTFKKAQVATYYLAD